MTYAWSEKLEQSCWARVSVSCLLVLHSLGNIRPETWIRYPSIDYSVGFVRVFLLLFLCEAPLYVIVLPCFSWLCLQEIYDVILITKLTSKVRFQPLAYTNPPIAFYGFALDCSFSEWLQLVNLKTAWFLSYLSTSFLLHIVYSSECCKVIIMNKQ